MSGWTHLVKPFKANVPIFSTLETLENHTYDFLKFWEEGNSKIDSKWVHVLWYYLKILCTVLMSCEYLREMLWGLFVEYHKLREVGVVINWNVLGILSKLEFKPLLILRTKLRRVKGSYLVLISIFFSCMVLYVLQATLITVRNFVH